jgi:glycosyltransferase involved in cell wall biosynthesis
VTDAAPRVTIVMPVLDAGRHLAAALASVEAQTRRDFELVIVDDGSTDPRTLALLDEAARRPGVRIHRQATAGPAAARNRGIADAHGTYVLPLDADDTIAPTFLERTVAVLDAAPEAAIVHTWVGLTGAHHGTWKTGPFALRALLARCTIHVCSLYRRTVWEDVGGYDPRFVDGAEDWDFWLSAAARGWTALEVPEVLARYRRSAGSRERAARQPGTSGRLMRTLVAKHRALYEAHLDDALAAMFEEREGVCLSLERIYDHPAARVFLRLRGLLS